MCKKVLAVFMTVVMVFGVIGCSSKIERAPIVIDKDISEIKDNYDFSELALEYMNYFGSECTNRMLGDEDHDKAKEYIIDELKGTGYSEDMITTQKVAGVGENVILKVDGQNTDYSIVVGAHYDGDGVGDNGSGAALLLATAVGLYGTSLPVTTYFVFFDCEEIGLFGSQKFANSLSKTEKESIIYMINIDSIAFGDYANVYGGTTNNRTGEVTGIEGYEHAMNLAAGMGINTYGTSYLDGYYSEHGEGPSIDPNGLYTNPWTADNPAPIAYNSMLSYSPSTIPASDHVAFTKKGITYIYFEATNWFGHSDNDMSISYNGYTDVGDSSLGEDGMIMNTEFDTLEYLEENFPGRALEHFEVYSPLLSALILIPMT